MEIQGVDTNRLDDFPYSGLRVLGAIQIGVGLITMALGTFDVGLVMAVRESERKTLTSRNDVTTFDTIVTMSITGTPIWCGIWRQSLHQGDFRWLVSLCVGFLAFLEVVIATVSAAMCCCCSRVNTTKVRTVV
ncbi:uncharacterized protein LOC121386007 [Gigantopelta aegis]|uniref:uncharacterized protein LOC121386007 n=1 Tax=Gigantopelta aegis TaxID=1735272 RepID=UPI001B88DAB2|nr:uncharacterized protein LOC121386007 [Gigantopelta aegis]